MKAGDLVRLSSAGKKSQQNAGVAIHDDAYGLILEILQNGCQHPYKIQWFAKYIKQPHMLPMARYEIKYYKK